MNYNCTNYVSMGYFKINQAYTNMKEIYSLSETRNLLLNNNYYLKFRGKSKNRTLQKENLKLYKSVFENTKLLDEIFYDKKHLRQFYKRLLFIVDHNYDIESLKCECGKTYTFGGYCRSCKPTYPSEKYFKWKFGTSWQHEQKLDKKMRIEQFVGHLSAQWFYKKYGEDNWHTKYVTHYHKIHKNNKVRYSKISQELFWKIYDLLDTSNNCYFTELNNEWWITLKRDESMNVNQSQYYLDFLYNNKNIEFDGSSTYYEKSDNYIISRDKIIESRWIDILRVNENEYHKNKDQVIKQCVEFISC